MKLSTSLGYVPSHRTFVKYYAELGIRIPKKFTNYRFGGNINTLTEIVEDRTGLKRIGFDKTDQHKKNLSLANTGKLWWSCDELMKSIQSKEENLDTKYIWYRGRKYGTNNRVS